MVTFEGFWQRRLPADTDLAELPPAIDAAGEVDRQVTVPFQAERDAPPVSLDTLADEPWTESGVLAGTRRRGKDDRRARH